MCVKLSVVLTRGEACERGWPKTLVKVAELLRNGGRKPSERRPNWIGISGRFASEYAIHASVIEDYVELRTLQIPDDRGSSSSPRIHGLSFPELHEAQTAFHDEISQMRAENALEYDPRASVIHASLAVQQIETAKLIARIEQFLHNYLSSVEQELLRGQSESVLSQNNRRQVNEWIASFSADVANKLQAATDRLLLADPESRSQAMTSCRRALKAVADYLYPASNESIKGVDGIARVLDDGKYVSRLWQFASQRIQNDNSNQLFQNQLESLGSRIDQVNSLASKGVHSTVSEFEAYLVVSQTYWLIGDLLRLKQEGNKDADIMGAGNDDDPTI